MRLSELKKMSLSKTHQKICSLEEKIKELEDDRAEYRRFIKNELQLQMQVQAEGKYYTPKACIERLVATVSIVKPYRIWW